MANLDYAMQIEEAIRLYEDDAPYKWRSIDWICDRIDWCWKWRKITEQQMEHFASRIIKIMEDMR